MTLSIEQSGLFATLMGWWIKPLSRKYVDMEANGLKAHADAQVGDRELAAADKRFPVNPPQTKEAYVYRALFERFFPTPAAALTVPGGKSIACSSPAAIAWDAAFADAADPSGRAVAGVHEQALV